MDRSGLREYILKPGYIFFTADPTMILAVLGTSVAVTFFDREKKAGGMNHFVYPWLSPEVQPTALYARPAMMQLIRLFHHAGSRVDKIEAHVIGGATPEDADGNQAEIGRNNVEAAVRLLEHYGIPIAGQEIGGRQGRKVLFNSSTGELVIAKVDQIRSSDWYPDAHIGFTQSEEQQEDTVTTENLDEPSEYSGEPSSEQRG